MVLCKKLISIVIFASMITYFGALTVLAANTVSVSASVVNVRSGASLDAAVVEKLSQGQMVNAISVEGDWFKVDTNTSKGVFINREFSTIVFADGVVNVDGVNIRSQASTSSEILGKANAGMKISVIGQSNDFYIFYYNSKKAYIHSDYVNGDLVKYVQSDAPKAAAAQTTAPKAATTAAAQAPAPKATAAVMPTVSESAKETTYALVLSENGINLRNAPGQDGEIMLALSYSEAVDVLEIGNEWHKVSYNGIVGYISSDFSMVKTGIKPENSVRASLVNYAQQFLGTPYVWAGTNLKTGVDCSGFTYAVYKNFGITLNRSSRDQIANGKRVNKSELVQGDLVFFDTEGGNNGNISHVGIYIGDGKFVHASSSSKSPYVTISSLYDDYYVRTYVAACRVL